MRKSLVLLITILISAHSVSQSADSVKLLADAAVKTFTWDLEKIDKGTLMFLDVPFTREGQDSAEYLTLTVAKNKSAERPEWISVIVPNNIVQSNGIFIAFANTVKTPGGESKMELEKKSTRRLALEGCKGATCTARILEGYLSDEKTGEPIDIFQSFLDYDHVLILLTYENGTHKSVAIPLFTFKQQYKTL